MSEDMIIRRIWIDKSLDENPDTSYIGEYSDNPGPNDRTIDRMAMGDQKHNQYRYFVAAMSGKETGNLGSVKQDYERMEAFNKGEWHYLGIVAKAEIQTSQNSVIQTICSYGLYGIESDSGPNYLQSVAEEELQGLVIELKAIGFSKEQIGVAIYRERDSRNI
jgi:hypothetical protein